MFIPLLAKRGEGRTGTIEQDEDMTCARLNTICQLVCAAINLRMTIALAKDVEDFLADQVRSGHCNNASELVNDVLRSLRDQQRESFEITPKLESWLLEAADSPTAPLTRQDFDSIRERVQNRVVRADAHT